MSVIFTFALEGFFLEAGLPPPVPFLKPTIFCSAKILCCSSSEMLYRAKKVLNIKNIKQTQTFQK